MPDTTLTFTMGAWQAQGNTCDDLYLNKAENQSGSVEDEEHQDQDHHRLGQHELSRPPAGAPGPVKPLGFGHLCVDLREGKLLLFFGIASNILVPVSCFTL